MEDVAVDHDKNLRGLLQRFEEQNVILFQGFIY